MAESSTDALVERDVALRDCAHNSLQVSTGKDLPPDAKQWEAVLHQPNSKNVAGNQLKPVKFFGIF